jgi:hypothetical protein
MIGRGWQEKSALKEQNQKTDNIESLWNTQELKKNAIGTLTSGPKPKESHERTWDYLVYTEEPAGGLQRRAS